MDSADFTALLAVPTHSFGSLQPKGKVEEGELELAEVEYFERAYPGVYLERSREAHDAEMRRFQWLTGITI